MLYFIIEHNPINHVYLQMQGQLNTDNRYQYEMKWYFIGNFETSPRYGIDTEYRCPTLSKYL
jgi:hypothetical protein